MDKKPSLKQYLMNELIKEGYLSIEKVHEISRILGHKESNAERRLRASESPLVEAIKNEKGYITGYRYKNYIPQPKVPIQTKLFQEKQGYFIG